MAQYRVQVSNGGLDENVGGTWDGVKDAARDPFTWYFCFMHFALVTAQSFKDFLPSIMNTFGFDKLTTYLVQAPPYAIAYAAACGFAYTSGRFQESYYHIIIPIVFSAVGCATLIGTLNVGARYFGLILLISGEVFSAFHFDSFTNRLCALCRNILWPQSPAVLGNHSRSRTKVQESRANCHCQLHQSDEPLVQPILLPHVAGALLPSWWWLDLVRLPCHCCGFVVGIDARKEIEQEVGRG